MRRRRDMPIQRKQSWLILSFAGVLRVGVGCTYCVCVCRYVCVAAVSCTWYFFGLVIHVILVQQHVHVPCMCCVRASACVVVFASNDIIIDYPDLVASRGRCVSLLGITIDVS